MPYFSKGMDLCIAYNMEAGTMESIQFEYLNLIVAYMQCLGPVSEHG